MNVLFLTRRVWPNIGGVEKHVDNISKILKRRGHEVSIISEKDIKYPHIKYFGLIFIWFWLFQNKRLIKKADIIHCHDVFIWYLPFKFLYPGKRVYTTFHGWETIWPIPWKNILMKKLAAKFSNGTIAVGEYIEKYYRIKTDKITYGGITLLYSSVIGKKKDSVVFVGRLEKDTGLLQFFAWLDKQNKKLKIDFVGDGELRLKCKKYGSVYGFANPDPFYKKAQYCVPGGYLAALEALLHDCGLKLFWDDELKKDYWRMSPFYKLKGEYLKKWASKQTWEKLTNEYLDLYNSIK